MVPAFDFWGIDAPSGEDSDQYRCGALSANKLDQFIASRPVNCSPISLDRYGCTVATSTVGNADLGQWFGSDGLALDWPQYSKGRYGAAQLSVQQAGIRRPPQMH
jgi:endonuclease YncB( thermonuclease family)